MSCGRVAMNMNDLVAMRSSCARPQTDVKKSPKDDDALTGEDIHTPGPHDVLLGRGGGTNNHGGNIKFRKLVNQHKMRYLACSKLEKPTVAREVVALWRKMEPAGRFLSRREEGKRLTRKERANGEETIIWYEVGDKKAREKASQCLRERTAEVVPYIQQLHAHNDHMTKEGVSMVSQQLKLKMEQQALDQIPFEAMAVYSGEQPGDFSRRMSMPNNPQAEQADFISRRGSMPSGNMSMQEQIVFNRRLSAPHLQDQQHPQDAHEVAMMQAQMQMQMQMQMEAGQYGMDPGFVGSNPEAAMYGDSAYAQQLQYEQQQQMEYEMQMRMQMHHMQQQQERMRMHNDQQHDWNFEAVPSHGDVPNHSGHGGMPNHSGHGGVPNRSGHGGMQNRSGHGGMQNHSGHGGMQNHSGHGGIPKTSGHTGFPKTSGHTGIPKTSGHTGIPKTSGHAGIPDHSGHGGQQLLQGDRMNYGNIQGQLKQAQVDQSSHHGQQAIRVPDNAVLGQDDFDPLPLDAPSSHVPVQQQTRQKKESNRSQQESKKAQKPEGLKADPPASTKEQKQKFEGEREPPKQQSQPTNKENNGADAEAPIPLGNNAQGPIPLGNGNEENGEVTLEEYRKTLANYLVNNNIQAVEHVYSSADDVSVESLEEWTEDVDQEHKKRESIHSLKGEMDNSNQTMENDLSGSRRVRGGRAPPSFRRVSRNKSGQSMMSMKSLNSTGDTSIGGLSMLSKMSTGSGNEDGNMNSAKGWSSNMSLMSEMTDISQSIDDLNLEDDD